MAIDNIDISHLSRVVACGVQDLPRTSGELVAAALSARRQAGHGGALASVHCRMPRVVVHKKENPWKIYGKTWKIYWNLCELLWISGMYAECNKQRLVRHIKTCNAQRSRVCDMHDMAIAIYSSYRYLSMLWYDVICVRCKRNARRTQSIRRYSECATLQFVTIS